MGNEQMTMDESANPAENKFCDYYRIGFDIGIASVGWACMACDSEGNARHILDLGVRTFDIPENPQDGSSLAAPRREKRSSRRRLRRRNHRLERARALLGTACVHPDDDKGRKIPDVYELRVRALDERISEQEFARVLLLILKRRGYKSNGNREKGKDDEEGKVKASISANAALMERNGYRTVGEMIVRDPKFSVEIDGRRIYTVRNHNDYDKCILREDLEKEVRLLFAAQRRFGNAIADEDTEQKFLTIFTAQRDFDEGPGKGSRYSAVFKVGDCSFEPSEKRAPKASYTFEYFRMLQSINHLRIVCGGYERELSGDEKKILREKCLYQEKVSYVQVRKWLSLPSDAYFGGLKYADATGKTQKLSRPRKMPKSEQLNMFAVTETTADCAETAEMATCEEIYAATEKKTRFCGMPSTAQIRKCLPEAQRDNTELLDALGEILTCNKSESKIAEALNAMENAVPGDAEKSKLMALNFKGFGHMSVKAAKKVIPFLEQGYIYSDAMKKAGYDHANPYGETGKSVLFDSNDPLFREEFEDITSPAVRRAVSQTVKVLNAIIRKYGSPVAVNIELARELAKSWEDRKAIEKENKERFRANESKMTEIREKFGIPVPTGQDLVKYRLYEEQGGKCIYSDKPLDLQRVMTEVGYAQIDHIVPYSRSFCDARYNKVLVLSEENQKKGNKTPKEYLGDGAEWEAFCARINGQIRDGKKREMLLRERFTHEDGKAWKDRTLNDTKYISRFVYNQLKHKLLFADCEMGRERVKAVNGAITSYVRKRWGIQKVREDGDLHHAVDAAVIACVSSGFVQKITRYVQRGEVQYASCGDYIVDCDTGEAVLRAEFVKMQAEKLPMPHEKFRDELEKRLGKDPGQYEKDYFAYGYDSNAIGCVREVFVSRAPERKAKGAIHKETVYAYDEENKTVSCKTELSKLKLDENDEIAGYNEKAKQSDPLLYNALKQRLAQFGGSGEKAFAKSDVPFRKPKADGSDGPIVKKVWIDQIVKKVWIDQRCTAPIKLDRGRTNNDGMVRVDIFCRDDGRRKKWYGVPVYVGDIYRGVLPNKAAMNGKSEDDWLEMTEEYEYKFSLYKNDLVKIKSEKGIKFKPMNEQNPEKILHEVLVYYKGFDRSTASIGIMLHDNSYTTRGIGIQSLDNMEKYEADLLGEVHAVKSEKRPPAHMKNH